MWSKCSLPTPSAKERVNFGDGKNISLAEYAGRRSLQLITVSDFNQKLKEKGCPIGVSVQKMCKLATRRRARHTYVILYIGTIMFYWFPLALIHRNLWYVYAVLFAVSTYLNITSH